MTIQELEKKIQVLEEWKAKKEQQQLSNPVDIASQDLINQRVLLFANKSASTITADKSIKIKIDGQYYQINVL